MLILHHRLFAMNIQNQKMVPRRHTNPNKPKLVTPSAPSIETEPISLELFNRAAADLDTKGAIKLAKYRKLLRKHKS